MPWNPYVYNTFKNIRIQPFFDLSAMIQDLPILKAIDLGCGTGEQTALLSDKYPNAQFIGIDSSAEMLAQAKSLSNDRLHFKIASIEQVIAENDSWDLIFSNAALQWSDDHFVLFPKLIAMLNAGGQFAIQMPYQPDNKLNIILFNLAAQSPFKELLQEWNRPSSVLTLDAYTQIMIENGLKDIQVFQKVYPIIASDHDVLFDFISGSALIPYLEHLDDSVQPIFIAAFKTAIKAQFPSLPAIYAFKRVLLYGRR